MPRSWIARKTADAIRDQHDRRVEREAWNTLDDFVARRHGRLPAFLVSIVVIGLVLGTLLMTGLAGFAIYADIWENMPKDGRF